MNIINNIVCLLHIYSWKHAELDCTRWPAELLTRTKLQYQQHSGKSVANFLLSLK